MKKRKGDAMAYRLATILVLTNAVIVAAFFVYVLSIGEKLLASLDMSTASMMYFLVILTSAVFFSMFIGKSPEADEAKR